MHALVNYHDIIHQQYNVADNQMLLAHTVFLCILYYVYCILYILYRLFSYGS